jgi:molecular chaperone GrpE (heat shock protein)
MKWFRKRPGIGNDAGQPDGGAATLSSPEDSTPQPASAADSSASGLTGSDINAPEMPQPFEIVVRLGGPTASAPEAPAIWGSAGDMLPAGGASPDLQPVLEETASKIDDLATRQQELNSLFDSRLHSDEVQAKAVERLHDQLQEYKKNFIRQALMPLLKDVIYCHDFVASSLDAPPDPDSAAKTLGHVKQMLLDVLFKYDVEPFRGEDGPFDRKTQQCIKTVPTIIEADDKKVATSGVLGFRFGETIIRKEQVTVYKYVPVETPAPIPEPAPDPGPIDQPDTSVG